MAKSLQYHLTDKSKEMKELRLSMENEMLNGTKITKKDWSLFRARYNWYLEGGALTKKECRHYALLDIGIYVDKLFI